MIVYKDAQFTVLAMANSLLFGEVGFGDEYMKGNIVVQNNLADFIEANSATRRLPYLPTTSRRVAEHYNIPVKFYEMLLGETMAYTCANFNGDKQQSLKSAQNRKYEAHAEWLNLSGEKGSNLLDCGCGFGGFSRYVSKLHPDVLVDAVNLSEGQIEYATQRGNVSGEIHYHLSSWEEFEPRYKYGRFVSIGMLEHVGQKKLEPFFYWVSILLQESAVGTLQFISREKPMSKWFDKHIFPEAYTPTYNEVVRCMTGVGLEVTDTVQRGMDYAITLERWLDNFESNLPFVKEMGFDSQFIRMFRLYLNGGIASFRSGNSQLIQLRFVN